MAIKIADLFAGLKIRVDNSSIKAADKAIGDLKYALTGLGVYATARWFKGLIQDTVNLGGQLADTSQEIGIQSETLQQLGFAAAQSGSSLEGMTAALKILQRNAFAASKGGKQQAKAFSDMGIKFKEADGSLRPAEDLLADIADHISSLPDGTAKTGAAMKVFGRSGASLIPLLNEGSDGIAKLRKEFIDLGGQISDENVTALEAFGDEQDKFGVAMSGLRNTIALALLPTLRELTVSFLEWFKANQEWIRSGLRAAVAVLAATMEGLALSIRIVFKIFKWIVDHGVLLTVVILSIAGAFAVLRVQAMLAALMSGKSIKMLLAGWRLMAALAWAAAQMSIRAALASARAWVIANAPFLLIAATIAIVILLIDDLYSWITGGRSVLKDAWGELVDRLPGAWKIALDAMKLMFQDFWNFVSDGLAGIQEMFKDYDSAGARRALREEGKARGLKGKELDKFVEDGVKNEVTGNAAGVNKGPIRGSAKGSAAWNSSALARLGYSGIQSNVAVPAALRFAPPEAQAALAAAGGPMNFTPTINIQAPPGSDEKKIAEFAKTAFGEFFADQMRRTKAGAGK